MDAAAEQENWRRLSRSSVSNRSVVCREVGSEELGDEVEDESGGKSGGLMLGLGLLAWGVLVGGGVMFRKKSGKL